MSDGHGGLPSYKDLENAVLDGTAAIHCLTHERIICAAASSCRSVSS
jgi:hypothetical protein